MVEIAVQKQLIIEQDIDYGIGTVSQTRGGVNIVGNRVRTIVPVGSIEELNALDTNKFTRAALFSGTSTTFYNYYGGSWNKGTAEVSTLAELAALPGSLGQIVKVKGHTNLNVGGGNFICITGNVVSDNGDHLPCPNNANLQWKRINPKKTPYEFGFIDGANDASVAINACTNAYGACYLDKGKTYNIRYTVIPKVLHCIGGIATLNCQSPTNNTRFGGQFSAVYPSGSVGAPLEGVDVRNIIVLCNKLIGSSGSVGIKGFIFQQLKQFYQSGCTVINSASYGFWDLDTSEIGTTYCSGIRENCTAIDCAVSFEQVNVRGVTLRNCVAYTSTSLSGYAVECQFHPYGGSDMQLVYENCRGIADGPCPVIMMALLTCKNVTVNNCTFINNYISPGNITAAFYCDASGGDFDLFQFNDCVFTSLGSSAVTVQPGALGSTTNNFAFSKCKITGNAVGVQFNGVGGRYSFADCTVFASAASPTQPWAYYNNGSANIIQITRGHATASGPSVGATATNLSASSFVGTIQTPAGIQQPIVRQKVLGQAVMSGDGSTYSQILITMPFNFLNWTSQAVNTTKIEVNFVVDSGLSGAVTYPASLAMAYPYVVRLESVNQLRIIANTVVQGKTVRYSVTEYE